MCVLASGNFDSPIHNEPFDTTHLGSARRGRWRRRNGEPRAPQIRDVLSAPAARAARASLLGADIDGYGCRPEIAQLDRNLGVEFSREAA